MPRFFRRLAEGIFDEEDLIRRTHELADFIEQASVAYAFDRKNLLGVGYSNGANIAINSSLMLLRPNTLIGAALLRPMVPIVPETLPDLRGTSVLVAAGQHDPIPPAQEARHLADLLRNAGADVTVSFENAGHGLTNATVDIVRRWLTKRGSY